MTGGQLGAAPAQYFVYAVDEAAGVKGGAPTRPTLITILQEKRSELLTQLRDIEQTVDAMESQPNFEALFQRVARVLEGRKIR